MSDVQTILGDVLDTLRKNGIELFHVFDVDYLKDKYALSKIENPKVICRFEIPRYSGCTTAIVEKE